MLQKRLWSQGVLEKQEEQYLIVLLFLLKGVEINFAIETGGKFWIKIKKSFDKYSDICYII